MSNEILSVKDLSISYDSKKIIQNINISIEQNQIVCILGKSGVGKTTLFNIISGLLKPDDGYVLLNGENITGKPGFISYMFQKDLLLPYKTILDNVCLPLVINGLSKNKAKIKALSCFPVFGLQDTQNKFPHELSGGMRQRAALLRTYLYSHGVALLDEPFSALDSFTKTSIHKWYLEIIKKINLSTLLITHDVDEAITLSDKIYILSGTPGEVTYEIKIEKNNINPFDFVYTNKFTEYKKLIKSKII